jgi:hypothetical protein
MKRFLWLCLFLACGSATALDWKVGEPGVLASPTNGGFTIQPPSGWFYTSRVGVFAAAHNGALLDFIRITQTPYDRAVKNFKKPISIDTPPEELAEDYVAALQNEGLRELNVLSTEPVEVGGRPAFRMHLEYRLPEGYGGALMEEITLGATTENGVLLAHYFGAKIHYFQASLPAAEEALRTLTFVPLTK